ncbi:PleD family two-component system response regulator [Sphingomonas sp. GCM10030256]|uniref:response regulator n=1 Tax=Sphingomonas sp. GCM10030256 TaxID=3273427 RepID=UPI0036211614
MDPHAPAPGRIGPRILVVSQNRSHLAVLARRLRAEGYQIAAADSGIAAIAELHRAPADLVLSELVMVPMSGVELTRAVRGETAWRDLPVMLIAGRAEPDGAVRAYAAGADDVILKPFFFEILAARIERRLASAHALRQLREDNATLDARVVERAIELGELRDRYLASEAERRRLATLMPVR